MEEEVVVVVVVVATSEEVADVGSLLQVLMAESSTRTASSQHAARNRSALARDKVNAAVPASGPTPAMTDSTSRATTLGGVLNHAEMS